MTQNELYNCIAYLLLAAGNLQMIEDLAYVTARVLQALYAIHS